MGKWMDLVGSTGLVEPPSPLPTADNSRTTPLLKSDQSDQSPADRARDSRLHPCPGCEAQGRPKWIPIIWQRCAVCDAARPVVLPLDQWDAESARALIQATLRG